MWLRYKTSAAGAWTTEEFDELVREDRDITEGRKGRTLGGRGYAHVLYTYRTWTVTLSADTIMVLVDPLSSRRTFMKAFFRAPFKEMSLEDEPDVDDWIAVITEPGEEPVEFLENHRWLPEYSFTLESVDPLEE